MFSYFSILYIFQNEERSSVEKIQKLYFGYWRFIQLTGDSALGINIYSQNSWMGRSDTEARAIVSIYMDIYTFLTATGVKNIWPLNLYAIIA